MLCAQIIPVHVHKQNCEDIVMTPWQLSFTVTPGGQSCLTQAAQQHLQSSGLAGRSLPAYTFQHFTYSNNPRHFSTSQTQMGSTLRPHHRCPFFAVLCPSLGLLPHVALLVLGHALQVRAFELLKHHLLLSLAVHHAHTETENSRSDGAQEHTARC